MRPILSFSLLIVTSVMIFFSCNTPAASTTPGPAISHDSLVSRGKYLVAVIGCGDCHSPKKFGSMGPEEDTTLLLSGHPSSVPLAFIDSSVIKNWVLFNGMQTAVAGPWGVSFSANITSDSTGIGTWTEAQFKLAIRQGKSKGLAGGRMLLPPMPWQDYARMNDADIDAIFAYLKTTKPVHNVVPAPIAPGQYNKKI